MDESVALRPWQEESREWLKQAPRRYLADEMRVGKTAPAIRAAEELGVRRLVVVAPAIALPMWRAELTRWGYTGESWMISYAVIARDDVLRSALSFTPDLVILDEAHYAKNWRARRTKAAMLLARRAPRAWLLSGTPMPNDPSELWTPVASLWPERMAELGITSGEQWLRRTCRVIDGRFGPRVIGLREDFDLAAFLRPFMLRRRFSEVAAGMNEPLWWRTQVLDGPTLESLLSEAEREALEDALDDGPSAVEALVASARRVLADAKAPAVASLIAEEVRNGLHAFLLLGWHVDALQRMADLLREQGVGVGVITGATSPQARQVYIERFEAGDLHGIVGNIRAMGTAVTLSRAEEVFFSELSWTPGDNRQAAMRGVVVGQGTLPVRVLTLPGTLDGVVQRWCLWREEMQEQAGLA